MEKYKLTIDQKVSIWERVYVEVEANNLEEAVEKCKDEEYEVYHSEYLDWTEQLETPDENSTYEIYLDGNFCNMIYSNYDRQF